MTGIVTSLPPLIEQPPGNNSSNPAGLPGVTYQTAVLNITQTWTALQTFPQGNISIHYQDVIGLSSSASVDTTNAANITSGTLPAARLPNPTASTLGGVESIVALAHNWISSISTAGVPVQSQPAFSDISGVAAASQLPNPTASTLGGVQSVAAVSHQWIASISTSGVPVLSQPAFTDISGQATLAQLPTLGANTVMGSIAGGTPIALTTTQHTTLINTFTTTLNGSVPAPTTSTGKFLRDDATWQTAGGTGTVTSIGLANTYGLSISGSPVTVSGNITANVALTTLTNSLSGNVTMGSASTYFDGPSTAQGTSGTWLATGSVSVSSTTADVFNCKLWDGTTVIASSAASVTAGGRAQIAVSGVLATPAGNIKMSCQNISSANGAMVFSNSGLSKDSTLTVVRIA